MDKRKEEYVILLFAFLILLSTYFIFDPSIIGFVIYENETIDEITQFSYNTSLISIGDDIRLNAIIEDNSWTDTNYTSNTLTAAHYKPDDEVINVEGEDDNYVNVKKGEIFNVIFSQVLENNDIITLKIRSGGATNIYLCEASNECDFSEYGSVYYNGTDNLWLNISISNLDNPLQVFALDVTESLDFDYIYSSKSGLLYTYKDYDDKLSKLDQIGGGNLDTDKDEILNIMFSEAIQNGDIINLLLENSDASDIYLCDPSTICNSPGYGLINFNGSEGWYSIAVEGLESPMKMFNLDPVSVKIDYVNATRSQGVFHNVTNLTYFSSNLETSDIEPGKLSSWNSLNWNHTLNNQDISYMYSIDSGLNWVELVNSSLDFINSTKIKFKILMETNTSETPILHSLKLNYNISYEENETTEDSPAAPSGGGGGSSGGGSSSRTGVTETSFDGEVLTDTSEVEIETKEETRYLINPILSSGVEEPKKGNKPLAGSAVRDTETNFNYISYLGLGIVLLVGVLFYFFYVKKK